MEVEKPFVPEYVESPQDGVLVHPEYPGQVFGQRKTFSWTSFALGDRPSDLGGHLVVKWDRFWRSTLTEIMVLVVLVLS